MSDLVYWKYTEETQKVLHDIKEEISRIQQELIEGSLLSLSDSELVARGYAKQIGKLEGLQYIERIFELDAQEEEDNGS